jgi:hypothetical protein
MYLMSKHTMYVDAEDVLLALRQAGMDIPSHPVCKADAYADCSSIGIHTTSGEKDKTEMLALTWYTRMPPKEEESG